MSKSVMVRNLTKRYKLYSNNKERLKDIFLPKSYGEAFFALREVSFEAEKGDVIGFVGVNGSGKSTLSNIIAGIVPQTSGQVEIEGQASLIAVAAGLNGELTGRENIELKCLMMGFTKEKIISLEPDIIEFSELGKFIDQPVKAYSSGMKSRLGFAISINTDPDVLIIDEALSVGDKAFADKCLKKMEEFKTRGKTMFFVSHSIGQMKKFCEKGIWLEHGEVKMSGTIEEVIPAYESWLTDYNKLTAKQKKEFQELGYKKRSDPGYSGKV